MSIVRHSSGNLNEIRAYPFADTADRITADGLSLPEFVIVDCHLWWPDTYGTAAYVSAVTVSANLITVVIAAVNRSGGVATPIAVTSVVRPHTAQRSYELNPLVPGVGGWMAFGNVDQLPNSLHTWMFNTPARSELLARLAHAYPSCPVLSASKYGSDLKLVGSVRLLNGVNVNITTGVRSIEGIQKRCIIFSLPSDQLPELYSRFAGPCGRRPESGTCDKQPIRSINNVLPDADGVIDLTVTSDGTITGRTEVIDGLNTGIALSTPVSFDDVCADPDTFNPVYDNICETDNNGGAGQAGSSSSAAVISSSSSSLSGQELEVLYDMLDVTTLNDWSVFTKDGNVHALDWVVSDNEPDNADTDFTFSDGVLRIPFSRTTAADSERVLASNAYGYSLASVGTYVTINSTYTLSVEDLSAAAVDEAAAFEAYVELTTPILNQDSNSAKIIRATVAYVRLADSSWKATLRVAYLFDGTWTTLSSTDYFFAQPYYKSSSSGTVELDDGSLHEDLSLSAAVTSTSPTAALSVTVTYNGNQVSVAVDDATYIPAVGSVADVSRFAFGVKTVALTTPTLPLAAMQLFVDRIRLAGNVLAQSCDESDFVGADVDTPFALDYLPALGWSNDFGTTRAMAQLAKKVNASAFQQYALDLSGEALVYGPQFLRFADGANHKYAVSNCDNSVLNDRYFSVAIKAVSGNPKAGLMLGYQETALEHFWAVMIDLAAKRITYGMHYIGHNFQPQSWVSIFGADASDWSTSWQRLIVRVTGPAPYTVQAWIGASGFTSSSAPNRYKTIVVDDGSPIYAVAGKTEWNGMSISTSQFADGAVGLYAYGGEVDFAELTVSPAGQDIVVPNKCPWLPV